MNEDALVAKLDQQYALTPDARHLMIAQMYRDALVRLENNRTTDQMLRYTGEMLEYTRQVRRYTLVMVILTLVQVAILICR